ncbi:hypothetical protein CRUP_016383 [Coryphaenoides rupestris]|nr:hypothetical protein CRUP_016383 [Coryphaenoides rupestris]
MRTRCSAASCLARSSAMEPVSSSTTGPPGANRRALPPSTWNMAVFQVNTRVQNPAAPGPQTDSTTCLHVALRSANCSLRPPRVKSPGGEVPGELRPPLTNSWSNVCAARGHPERDISCFASEMSDSSSLILICGRPRRNRISSICRVRASTVARRPSTSAERTCSMRRYSRVSSRTACTASAFFPAAAATLANLLLYQSSAACWLRCASRSYWPRMSRRAELRCAACSWACSSACSSANTFLRKPSSSASERRPASASLPASAVRPASSRAPRSSSSASLRRRASSSQRSRSASCSRRSSARAFSQLSSSTAGAEPAGLSLVERVEAGAGGVGRVAPPQRVQLSQQRTVLQLQTTNLLDRSLRPTSCCRSCERTPSSSMFWTLACARSTIRSDPPPPPGAQDEVSLCTLLEDDEAEMGEEEE